MMAAPAHAKDDSKPLAWTELEDLYRSSRNDIYAYLFTFLGERAAAEDATEQAFEHAFKRWPTFDPTRGSARQWLFGIARNAALDELRRRRRRPTTQIDPRTPDDAPDHATEFAEADEYRCRQEAVTTAVARLGERERELIALKFHAELTNQQIAVVLGVSETNAGTMLCRAIGQLRRSLNV